MASTSASANSISKPALPACASSTKRSMNWSSRPTDGAPVPTSAARWANACWMAAGVASVMAPTPATAAICAAAACAAASSVNMANTWPLG